MAGSADRAAACGHRGHGSGMRPHSASGEVGLASVMVFVDDAVLGAVPHVRQLRRRHAGTPDHDRTGGRERGNGPCAANRSGALDPTRNASSERDDGASVGPACRQTVPPGGAERPMAWDQLPSPDGPGPTSSSSAAAPPPSRRCSCSDRQRRRVIDEVTGRDEEQRARDSRREVEDTVVVPRWINGRTGATPPGCATFAMESRRGRRVSRPRAATGAGSPADERRDA